MIRPLPPPSQIDAGGHSRSQRDMGASEANQHFSELLRDVSEGQSVTVMSRGRPVAEDDGKIAKVRELVSPLAESVSLIAPAQALDELFVVLRRSGASAEDAREVLLEFAEAFGTSASETRTALSAADLVVDHRLQFWDALIVTAAADAGCALPLSEDMQHGFVTRGLTIIHPLADDAHPKLTALIEAS